MPQEREPDAPDSDRLDLPAVGEGVPHARMSTRPGRQLLRIGQFEVGAVPGEPQAIGAVGTRKRRAELHEYGVIVARDDLAAQTRVRETEGTSYRERRAHGN